MQRFLFIILAWYLPAQALLASGPAKPPVTPRGFSWLTLDAVRAHVLRPRGWHVASTRHGGVLRWVVSQQPDDSEALRGASLVIVVQPGMRGAQTARQRVVAAAREYDAAGYRVVSNGLREGKRIITRSILYEDRRDPARRRIAMRVLMGNKVTNTLYDLRFMTPKIEWPRQWSRGKKMLGLFQFDLRF